MKTLGLYLHIPFCVQKCNYCDFLSAPATEETMEKYCISLCKEIAHQGNLCRDYIVDTVFLGGGTPSILPVRMMERLMDAIRKAFVITDDAEISMECNPGTVTYDALKVYSQLGVNRISFGLQSTEQEDLKRLGRIHSYETFLDSYQDARRAGFSNINIDLMASLPGQDTEKFLHILQKVVALSPEHLSVYSLIVEEGTRFYDWYERGEESKLPPLPDEETDRKIYHETRRFLQHQGYERYEISNYAKIGYESRHNIKYWNRSEYLGLGLGASSMMNNVRWHNVTDLITYLQGNFEKQEMEELTIEDCMSEYMFLGLRMMKGVSVEKFEEIFGKSVEEIYGDVICKHVDNGLLVQEDGWIWLTEKGIDVSNYVMSDFL